MELSFTGFYAISNMTNKNGEVEIYNWSVISLVFWCEMNFDPFPFDRQVRIYISIISMMSVTLQF